jgi:predicted outer membrane repeat protein
MDAAKRHEPKHKRCPDGKTRCSGVCVDTQSDPQNCGSCGNDCEGDEVCRNGECVRQQCTVCDDDDECPFQSVQSAIDAATPGSVITICEGTYRENIVIAKDVELRGVNWEGVTLEGAGQGLASVIVVRREVTALVGGVAIEGGAGTLDPILGVRAGGGIYLEPLAALTLTDANVGENEAEVGAGIFSGTETRLTLKNTTVAENEAKAGSPRRQTFGGGIYTRPAVDLQVSDNSVIGRNFADIGGGIYNQGVIAMSDSLLVGNEAKLDGGGLLNDGGVATFTNVLVGRNTASTRGGGVHVDGGRLDLDFLSVVEENKGGSGGGVNVSSAGRLFSTRATIRKNDAKEDGGGIYSEGGEIVLTQTSVVDNDADERGGGVFCTTGFLTVGSLTLEESDVSGNKAGDTGGGIFSVPSVPVTLDADSRVRRNKPNNCVGTAACNA